MTLTNALDDRRLQPADQNDLNQRPRRHPNAGRLDAAITNRRYPPSSSSSSSSDDDDGAGRPLQRVCRRMERQMRRMDRPVPLRHHNDSAVTRQFRFHKR